MSNDGATDYQALNVVIGTHLFTGFARGDSFQVSFDEDESETLVGNRGLGAWIRRINQAATVTIELFQNSDDNIRLQSMLIANRRSRRGFGSPMVARDLNGATTYSCHLLKVVKQPDFARGDTIGSYIWTLRTTRMNAFLAGTLPAESGSMARAAALAVSLAPLPVAV